jgi:hypothetical protein
VESVAQAATESVEAPLGEETVTREGFARWWQLVTDPEHVSVEKSQMPEAWCGAKAYMDGEYDDDE